MAEDPRTEEEKRQDRETRARRIEHLTKCVGMPLDFAEIVEDLSSHALAEAIDKINQVANTAPHGLGDIVKTIALQMIHFNVGAALQQARIEAFARGIQSGDVIIILGGPEEDDSAGADTVH